ncbi:ATP-binding protein [Kitasatospora sp. KL5]|uniref:ATP-binding protein n=1 Tax=Kitasatospora sp. KL5 TaxID=3425125 RepID=UPI003D6E7E93
MGDAGATGETADESGEFRRLLAEFRLRAGLTQDDLARAAGVSLRALGDMERGRTRGPQRRTVQALASALRLTPRQAAALEQAAAAGRPRRTPAATDPARADHGNPAADTAAAAPARPAGPTPCALSLPRDIADFTAREEALAQLQDLARDETPAHPRIVLINGQPGLGKTAFALHAAHRLTPHFPDGQLSLHLGGMAPTPLSPRDALAQILRALGIADAAVPAGTEERAGLYRALVREKRLVLILDDAADETQVRPLLPGSGPTLTIVTSRHTLPGLESVHRLGLAALTPTEAATLLGRIAGHRRTAAEPTATAELARLCGHLPLALRIAGQRLAARPQLPIDRLVRQLADEEHRLDLLEAGDLGVRAAFTLSYHRLPDTTRLVLRRCALTAGQDFTPDTVGVYAGLPTAQTDRHLERLTDAGLLHAATADRYLMHDLVRLYAGERLTVDEDRSALAADRDRADDRLLRRAAACGLRFDPDHDIDDRSGDPDPVGAPRTLADAARWLEEEHAEWLAALRRALAAGRHRQVIDTAEAMHWFSDRLMRWDTWGEVFQLSVDAARACGDVRAETVHLNYLAWTSVMCLHRYRRGIELAHDARELARRIGDAEQEAWALTYRATGLRYLQRYEEAATAYQQAAGVFAAVGNRPAQVGRLVSLRGAANCLRDTGRAEEAVETRCLALAGAMELREVWESHVPSLLVSFIFHELGLDRAALRDWAAAEKAYRQALVHYEAAGWPDTMTQTLTELGTALIEQGRAGEARALLSDALTGLADGGGRPRRRLPGPADAGTR